MAEVLLETSRLTRRFGGLIAVNSVDLAVMQGAIHGLIGPNGAGKTTLLNLIAAFFPASEGQLRFKGLDITRLSPSRRARAGIRRTFQNLKLFADMTALQNASMACTRAPRQESSLQCSTASAIDTRSEPQQRRPTRS